MALTKVQSGVMDGGLNLSASAPANTLVTDSNGNVGIGTSTPVSDAKLTISAPLEPILFFQRAEAGNFDGAIQVTSGGSFIFKNGADSSTAAGLTERIRIDGNGNLVMASRTGAGNIGQLRVGTTESTGSANGYAVFVGSSSTPYPMVVKGLSNDQGLVGFVSSSDVVIGSITKSVSATQYNTSSDYRLKENIAPMTGALGVVQQLKPVTYNWKVDGSAGQGFIAHELQEVVPDCVTGEKDAVETYTDEDGVEHTRPKYQGIDTSFLVATLTAAIQEQQAIITDLKARIETLEAK